MHHLNAEGISLLLITFHFMYGKTKQNLRMHVMLPRTEDIHPG